MPSWRVLVALQVLGVGAALVALARPNRIGFPLAWLCLLVLAGLRGSLGKILHNDVLLILAAVPFVIAAFGRHRDDRTWAPRAALVVISAAYFFSGYQKLLNSGLEWVFSDNFRWVLYGGAASGRAPTDAVTRFVADRPWLAVTAAGALLLMEVSFPIVLFVARTRPGFGAIAITMHAGTWITLGLDYWTWVAVDAIVLLYATAPLRRPTASGQVRAAPEQGAHPGRAASGTG